MKKQYLAVYGVSLQIDDSRISGYVTGETTTPVVFLASDDKEAQVVEKRISNKLKRFELQDLFDLDEDRKIDIQ